MRPPIAVPAVLAAAVLPLLAGGRKSFEPGPGPREMTAEERALAPDPKSGPEHGLILVHETARQDDLTGAFSVSRHVRAKIFSNEGRDIGNVELPFNAAAGSLKRWWGWTVCPDGSLAELKEEGLHETPSVRVGRRTTASTLRATLPAVQPGCVVDYGYSYWQPGAQRTIMRLNLQGEWPIRELRVRWTPFLRVSSAYRVARASGLKLSVERQDASVEIRGSDLPPAVEEPNAPPSLETRASAVLYYRLDAEEDPDRFWDAAAREADREAAAFIDGSKAKALLDAMSLPPGADLQTRLRLAHDWIGAHFDNDDRPRWDQEAAAARGGFEAPGSAKDVMERKRGSARQLDMIFLGVARAAGAQAHLVLATDRRTQYFDAGLMSTMQLTESAVATREPGTSEALAVFSDVGSGLPFGEVPWWLTGVSAVMATPEGRRIVTLWPAAPERNLSTATARVVLDLDGAASATWSRTDQGQQGLETRDELRAVAPPQRGRRLDDLCGAGGRFEVSKAESAGIDETAGDLRLTCEGTAMETGLSGDRPSAHVGFGGPWITAVPDLSSPSRTHLVIFPFPKIDRAVVEIEAPPGFGPGPATPPVSLESPYGVYQLTVARTPSGFHVERVFALGVVVVPPEEYDALRGFLQEVRRADGTRLEMHKQEGTP